MEDNLITQSSNTVFEQKYVNDLRDFFSHDNNFIEEFIKNKSQGSKNTGSSYRNAIVKFFNKPTDKITLEDINMVNYYTCYDFINRLTEENYAPKSISQYIASLSSLYKWLLKFNDSKVTVVKFNPFSLLKDDVPKPIRKAEPEILSIDEMRRILNRINEDGSITDLRDKIMLAIAFTTALRKSDIVTIKIKDIVCIQGYYAIKVFITKTKKEFAVKLQIPVKQMIDKYLEKTGRNYDNDREDYLFKACRGPANDQHISTRAYANIVNKRVKDAGISKHIKAHGTRHSAIDAALEKGVPLTKVKEFAGHNSVESTMNYVHTRINIKDNPGDVINIL